MPEADKGHPPVQLPAGSVDAQKLLAGLEKAHSVKDENQHPERINKAIVDAASDSTRETIANADRPSVPFGAQVVDQELVYAEGAEPVKSKGVAFKPAKGAKSGAEAAEMRYEEDDKGDVVATDEPPQGVVASEERDTASLGEVARDKVGDEGTGKK